MESAWDVRVGWRLRWQWKGPLLMSFMFMPATYLSTVAPIDGVFGLPESWVIGSLFAVPVVVAIVTVLWWSRPGEGRLRYHDGVLELDPGNDVGWGRRRPRRRRFHLRAIRLELAPDGTGCTMIAVTTGRRWTIRMSGAGNADLVVAPDAWLSLWRVLDDAVPDPARGPLMDDLVISAAARPQPVGRRARRSSTSHHEFTPRDGNLIMGVGAVCLLGGGIAYAIVGAFTALPMTFGLIGATSVVGGFLHRLGLIKLDEW